jgi:hypothetical protein
VAAAAAGFVAEKVTARALRPAADNNSSAAALPDPALDPARLRASAMPEASAGVGAGRTAPADVAAAASAA